MSERIPRVVRRREPWEPIGTPPDLSLFVGGTGLANRDAKTSLPIDVAGRLSVRTGDENPFRTQNRIFVDGMNPPPRSSTEFKMRRQRLPQPYPVERFATWKPTTRRIAEIPSVIVGGGKLQYPMRSLSPQKYLANYPILCGLRRKLNAFISA